MWAFLEVAMMFTLALLAIIELSSAIYCVLSLLLWITLIVLNVLYTVWFCKYTQKDEHFQMWKVTHKCSYRVFISLSAAVSFKIARFFYT